MLQRMATQTTNIETSDIINDIIEYIIHIFFFDGVRGVSGVWLNRASCNSNLGEKTFKTTLFISTVLVVFGQIEHLETQTWGKNF